MDEIGNILPGLFKKQMTRAEPHLLDILLPLWPRIAGRTMAQHAQPALFASGVLTLNADSATWGVQLRHMTDEIRLEINRFFGRSIVNKLRIKTVTQPELFLVRRKLSGTDSPRRPLMQSPADLDLILDPEIASALAVSYSKYFNRSGS